MAFRKRLFDGIFRECSENERWVYMSNGVRTEYNGSEKMVDDKIIERVAKNVGCNVETLMAKYESVRSANTANLEANGLSQEDIDMKCLRMASAELRVITARLQRSGCENIEGMFVSVPRTKDIAERQYANMKNTLRGLDEEARTALVAQGALVLFLEDDVNGGYRYIHNPSLESKQDFEIASAEKHMDALPKNAMNIEDGTGHFCLIADKSAPKWASGSPNYRYGRYKPQSEPMRDCVFLGRSADNPTIRPIKVRFNGEDAKTIHPTFITGRIPVKLGRNGDVGYTKSGVSVFSADESVVSIFDSAPFDEGGEGLLKDLVGATPLTGLGDLEGWLGSLSDKEKWDALCAMPLEVAHIDVRENGGFIITLADLDITSPIAPIDLWVAKEEESKVDFAVGSLVVAVGGGWIDKSTGMPRMSVSGWWVMDSVEGVGAEEVEEGAEEGADDMGW